MNRDVAEMWIADLESGKFPQSKGMLRNDAGFCCLGVLCDRAVREGILTPEEVIEVPTWPIRTQYAGEDVVLPRKVREWAGMKSDIGTYGNGYALTDENDIYNKTFPEIANVIASFVDNL